MAAALMRHPPNDFARLIFLGDLAARNDRDAPILDPVIAGALQSADLVVAGCGSPIVRRPHKSLGSWVGRRRHMNAGALLGLISAMGIETDRLVLSVAGGAVFDQGSAGYEETLRALRSLHVRTIGEEGSDPVSEISLRNTKVRLLAQSETCARVNQTPSMFCALPDAKSGGAQRPVMAIGQTDCLAGRGIGLIVPPVFHPQSDGLTYVACGLGTFHGKPASADPTSQLGAMFIVDIASSGAERGQIAAYELFPFARITDGRRERVVPLDALPRKMKGKVQKALSPAPAIA